MNSPSIGGATPRNTSAQGEALRKINLSDTAPEGGEQPIPDNLNSLLETLFKNHLNGIKIDASIDPSLTAATAQTLMDAVITAYQASLLGKPMPTPPDNHSQSNNQPNHSSDNHSSDIPTIDFTTPHTNALNNIAKNVYQFSVAKNYHELREMTDLLKNGNKIRSYTDFRKEALHIHNYYDQHLQTEYNTALSGAYNAASWTDYEESQRKKNALPPRAIKSVLLQFQTAGDSHVRASHRLLDGIVRPMNDPFWNTHMPPLDWNCRCTTVQITDYESQEAQDGLAKADPNIKIPKLFQTNLAKQNLVFPKDHPYFKDCPALLLKNGIFALPIADQFQTVFKHPAGGTVQVHMNYKPKEDDKDLLMKIAKEKAALGHHVQIMPEIYKSEKAAREKLLPNYTGNKNPDLKIDGKITEVKNLQSNTMRAFNDLLNKGVQQANHIIIHSKHDFSNHDIREKMIKKFDINPNLQTIETIFAGVSTIYNRSILK